MEHDLFVSEFGRHLGDERKRILASELETDFATLKKQRNEFSVPPRLYWTLKSLPHTIQATYIRCLLSAKDAECSKIKEIVSDRNRLYDNLELMEWAEAPSIEASEEQHAKFRERVRRSFGEDPRLYYKNQIRQLCNKSIVQRAFRNSYSEITGRRMRATEESSVFRDEQPIQMGDARIAVEWDCGGWTHFREEIWIEWKGKVVLMPQSVCSWLGYYPIGAEGWDWILQDDLEEAAHDAVQQTIQFRDTLCKCVRLTLE